MPRGVYERTRVSNSPGAIRQRKRRAKKVAWKHKSGEPSPILVATNDKKKGWSVARAAEAIVKSLPKSPEFALHWRLHTSSEFGPRRVWRSDWAGDQFEVLPLANFIILEGYCRQFAVPMVFHDTNEA